jgi:DedD protein
MGLFSFLSKNKQDRLAQDSGRFSRAEDDAIAERARSKRASSAGEGARRGRDGKGAPDPVLPEKKRARRRLVGAIALALAVAVGLPMLLDSEPKPLAGDIAIEIPSKDKAGPLPMPSDPDARPDAVAAADSVDKGEEIVDPKAAARAPAPRPDVTEVAEVHTPSAAQEHTAHADAPKEAAVKPEPKSEPKSEHKPARAAEAKAPEKTEKSAPRAAAKAEDKPATHDRQHDDAARALALLEGKQADKAHDGGEKLTWQVAALASQEKVAELQAKLRAAGIHSFTEKLERSSGELIRVKVGPYSKDEADKVRAKLAKIK